MEDISKYVANRIKVLRKENNLTQKQLGEKVGVKHNTISSYEKGTNQPEQNMLFSLADALNVSINEFFPKAKEESTIESRSRLLAAHIDDDVTDEQMEEILNYIDYIKSKNK